MDKLTVTVIDADVLSTTAKRLTGLRCKLYIRDRSGTTQKKKTVVITPVGTKATFNDTFTFDVPATGQGDLLLQLSSKQSGMLASSKPVSSARIPIKSILEHIGAAQFAVEMSFEMFDVAGSPKADSIRLKIKHTPSKPPQSIPLTDSQQLLSTFGESEISSQTSSYHLQPRISSAAAAGAAGAAEADDHPSPPPSIPPSDYHPSTGPETPPSPSSTRSLDPDEIAYALPRLSDIPSSSAAEPPTTAPAREPPPRATTITPQPSAPPPPSKDSPPPPPLPLGLLLHISMGVLGGVAVARAVSASRSQLNLGEWYPAAYDTPATVPKPPAPEPNVAKRERRAPKAEEPPPMHAVSREEDTQQQQQQQQQQQPRKTNDVRALTSIGVSLGLGLTLGSFFF